MNVKNPNVRIIKETVLGVMGNWTIKGRVVILNNRTTRTELFFERVSGNLNDQLEPGFTVPDLQLFVKKLGEWATAQGEKVI